MGPTGVPFGAPGYVGNVFIGFGPSIPYCRTWTLWHKSLGPRQSADDRPREKASTADSKPGCRIPCAALTDEG